MDFNNYTPTQTATHNEAIQQLLRLHDLWQSCNSLSSSGKLKDWKWKLDSVWRELSSSAAKLDETISDEKNKWMEKKKEIDKKVLKSKTPVELYNNLNEKEEFLRLLQDKAGKGTRWRDSEEDDFD